MGSPVSVYLCDPITLEIKYTFDSMADVAEALGITRQGVQDAVLKNHLSKGYRVIPIDAYEQLKER